MLLLRQPTHPTGWRGKPCWIGALQVSQWQKAEVCQVSTLFRAAIVTIRSLYVKAFEGSSADFTHATGFVVDA